MSKPTAAQMKIMERLADGESMSVNTWGTIFIHPRGRLAETVQDRTVAALKRGGRVSTVQLPHQHPHFVLTDAGRAVLAAGAEREGSRA